MKTRIFIFLFLLVFTGINAQTGFEAQNLALDIKHKPGEVIVKFKDDIKLKCTKSNNLVKTGLADVDKAFEKWSVNSTDQLFRTARFERNAGTIRFPDGTEKPIPQFHNIFLLKYPEKFDPEMVAQELSQLEEVEYAEANATAFIHGLIPVSESFSPDQLQAIQQNRGNNGLIPNDPLYDQQWYLPEVKADVLWETITGNDTEVIAVLDTGVDWLHPDLVNKIWQSPTETINNQDTDGNGFVDDIRGWDFVNNDNNPMDDNSHGTHCAGIAAAETNNGIGISGVSWGAKIMPVKVFQSNGVGYTSQIAEGIWYAAQNGATIFSNSWGGYGESITVRLAFEFAYSKGPIIAAAGNNNYKIDHPTPPFPPTAPMYPGSYNWVLGVEATQPGSWNAWFSNFDPTGPVISDGRPYNSIFYNDFELNYEVRAPGLSLISTVPNGQYRFYSGTSMATPIVAGTIALMKSYQPELSNEQVFSKLIQLNKLNLFQAGVLDIPITVLDTPPPDLYFVSYEVADSEGGNGNGLINAGETIEIYIKAKNAGYLAEDVRAKLRFAEFEDPTVATIIESTCSIGSISAYGTLTSTNPIRVNIAENVAHGRNISFEILLWDEGNTEIDTVVRPLNISVIKGIELSGSYSGLLHLQEEGYYLVTGPTVIDSLIIDPGITIRFMNNMFMMINQYIYASGEPNNMITFMGSLGGHVKGITMSQDAESFFNYCIFQDGQGEYGDPAYLINVQFVHNSIFRYNNNKRALDPGENNSIKYNVFDENFYWGYGEQSFIMITRPPQAFKYNILSNNSDTYPTASMVKFYSNSYLDLSGFTNNVFVNNNHSSVGTSSWNGWPMGIYTLPEQYWGHTDENYVKDQILDFFDSYDRAILNATTILEVPPAEAHGVVWKVEINGQNPMDGNLEPLGSGPAEFKVYFNRPMDITYEPFVTFGVRMPFTNNLIGDNTSWNDSHTIWTGYHSMHLSTGDGINTLRIANARDNEGFEIPIERNRFKFVVQVAGSQSIDFLATPGIGKVTLEWPVSEETDILGYNFYRFQMENGYPVGDTLLLNEILVTDSIYVDFSVDPDETYYYMFTQMKTDFTESDYSKVVNATPFSAANGDANGDMMVNVLDITTIVSYILNQNPQPFLNDAADVNYDGQINLLDIIGVVNLIMNKKAVSDRPYPTISQQKAYYEWKGHELWLQSEGNLAGLQFSLKLPDGVLEKQLYLKGYLTGFEMIWQQKDNEIECLIFSLDGKTIESGELMILELLPSQADYRFSFNKILGGELSGSLVEVLPLGYELTDDQKDLTGLFQVQPNPFSQQLQIQWNVEEAKKVDLEIYDLQGRLIKNLFEGKLNSGTFYWDGADNNGKSVSKGVYLLRLKYEITHQIKYIERKVIFK